MKKIKIIAKKTKIDSSENIVGKYKIMIRSRHPSHAPLRNSLKRLPFRSIVRFGSLTELDEDAQIASKRIELNSVEAIKNSSSKVRMKNCFKEHGVKTAEFIISNNKEEIIEFVEKVGFPIVKKSAMGSRGRGNSLIKNSEELKNELNISNLNSYVFEKYYNYNKEYRLHITKNGEFYSCRKMLKQEFKDHANAWQRHDDNCVWILPENPSFEKPVNWDSENGIVEHCVKALKSCGLDFGACDLRVQNSRDDKGNLRENPDFIVVEINSAPSFGDVTLKKYQALIPELLIQKNNERNK